MCLADEAAKGSRWLPSNPSKRWGEIFFLLYSPFWIIFFGFIVGFGWYESFDEMSYMKVCVGIAVPYFFVPFFVVGEADRHLPITERYWFKANIWIAIYSFIGNYFYTHYFYHVLHAEYTFPSWRLNDVPIPLFFATHAYFMFYHSLMNPIIRKLYTSRVARSPVAKHLWGCSLVLVLAYITAFMETLTISGFPYYRFSVDKYYVYTIGSAFYGIYFIVSFPMFLRLDETRGKAFGLWEVVTEALASCMLIFTLLDFWRLSVGNLDDTIRATP